MCVLDFCFVLYILCSGRLTLLSRQLMEDGKQYDEHREKNYRLYK